MMQTLVGQRWCFPDIALYLNTCEEQRDELVQRLGPAGFSLRGVKCAGLPGACVGLVGADGTPSTRLWSGRGSEERPSLIKIRSAIEDCCINFRSQKLLLDDYADTYLAICALLELVGNDALADNKRLLPAALLLALLGPLVAARRRDEGQGFEIIVAFDVGIHHGGNDRHEFRNFDLR